MEKVIPAGANRFGYESDTSPVEMPLNGRILANALTATITTNDVTTVILNAKGYFLVFVSMLYSSL